MHNKNKISSRKITKNSGLEMSLNMKSINKFTQQNFGLVDVTFMSASIPVHLKHHAQSGHSKRSALNMFNILSVFTHRLIRKQEIKFIMNKIHRVFIICMSQSIF